MRTLRVLLAVGALLPAFSALKAADANYGKQWLETYNQKPRVDDFVTAIYNLEHEGYFESAGQPEQAIGFFSIVFQQHPEKVAGWLKMSTHVVGVRPQRILAAAAWFAGSPEAGTHVAKLSTRDESGQQGSAKTMLTASPQSKLAGQPITSEKTLNLQWGSYLASGDERYITNVLEALGSNQSGLASLARYTLAQTAASDPRVLQICRADLDRVPAAMRPQFEAALNDAAARSKTPHS